MRRFVEHKVTADDVRSLVDPDRPSSRLMLDSLVNVSFVNLWAKAEFPIAEIWRQVSAVKGKCFALFVSLNNIFNISLRLGLRGKVGNRWCRRTAVGDDVNEAHFSSEIGPKEIPNKSRKVKRG